MVRDLWYAKKERVISGVLVCILMYQDNYMGDSAGGVMISGYQYRPPKRCFKIVNVQGIDDIEIDDDSVPYSYYK